MRKMFLAWLTRYTEVINLVRSHMRHAEPETSNPLICADPLKIKGVALVERGAGDDYPVTDYAKDRAQEFPPQQPASIQQEKASKFQQIENNYRNGC
jgi:hypothetical protein